MDFLPLLFGFIVAFAILVYITLDGFDLGIGILFLWDRNEQERDLMMKSVIPFWDGNETWLILGGGAFYGVFPKAAAILFPALYLPIMLMLFALIFRGVAFEFRFKAEKSRSFWSWAFCLGSLTAAFAQGTMLGAFIQGFNVTEGAFSGGVLDWLTPFSFCTGVALCSGYALLGSTWLMMKTSGTVQQKSFKEVPFFLSFLSLSIVGVTVWAFFKSSYVASGWLDGSAGFLVLGLIVTIQALLVRNLWNAVKKNQENKPFFLCVGLFVTSYLAVALSLWPYVVPHHLTIWEASSPYESQLFILIGVGLLVPVILGYTSYVFYVFRGKVQEDHSGY